jgi:hypothetical protein
VRNLLPPEVRPAQYGVVQETVVTRPAQPVAYRVPAQLGVVHQTVEVSPAMPPLARRIPAEYRIVHETVQVAPATRGWTIAARRSRPRHPLPDDRPLPAMEPSPGR